MNKRKRSIAEEASVSPTREASHTNFNHNNTNNNTSPVGPELNEALPAITRRITACAACRKQKIRCDMPDGEPPCTRCRRRSLSCVLNKSLQSLVDEAKNTNLLQADIGELYNTLNMVCEHLRLDKPKPLVSISNDSSGDPSSIGATQPEGPAESNSENQEPEQTDQAFPGCEVSPPGTPSAVQAPIDTFLDITKLGSPGSAAETPSQGGNGAGSVRSRRRSRHVTASQDLVSRGIISMADAEVLVHRYFTRIDSYLYGICSRLRNNIQRLRFAHPILFAAICTVSAVNDPHNQGLYEACNREFRRLVTQSLFEKHDLEYVRALCIASFYLADASRILLSDAVRRSADVHLHRSFGRLWSIAPKTHSNSTSPTDPSNGVSATEANTQAAVAEMRDRVRLWYLQFICDQHLSILYNRDPLLRSDTEIAISCEAYLRRDDINDTDVRIVSQVSLLRIMSQIRDILGSDLETRVPQSLANQVAYYSRQLDKWFTRFSALFKPDPYVGDFPRRGLQLHFQFSKLYLGHQVFKGLQGDAIPPPFMPAASMAHDAAISIFEMILYEEVLQTSLVGMPHYFLIMLAFAGHFLIEVTKTYSVQLGIVPEENLVLIRKVLTLFQNIPCLAQHPICRMTPGLNKKLMDCAASLSTTSTEILSENPDPVENRAPGVGAAGDLSSFVFPGDPLLESMDDVLLTDFGEFTFPEMLNMMP